VLVFTDLQVRDLLNKKPPPYDDPEIAKELANSNTSLPPFYFDSRKDPHDFRIRTLEEGILSQLSWSTSGPELIVVRLFGAILSQKEKLRSQHRQLTEQLGTSQFVNHYSRSLGKHALGLKSQARTASERDAVKVLEKQRNRRTIALYIVDHTVPNRDNARALSKGQERLEYRSSSAHGPSNAMRTGDEIPQDDTKDVEDVDDAEEDLEIAQLSSLTPNNVAEACMWLVNQIPIQYLSEQLWLFSLPRNLRTILDTTPCGVITIAKDNVFRESIADFCKGFVEDWTSTTWDWWPLHQRVPRPSSDGTWRLTWEVSTLLRFIQPVILNTPSYAEKPCTKKYLHVRLMPSCDQ